MDKRSSDDIRQYWNQKLLPLFAPNQQSWSTEEDVALLEFISDEDLRGDDNGCTLA